MNDFTKEELENILNGNVTLYPHTHCNLVNKIQSMIDNYCEHEWENICCQCALDKIYCHKCEKDMGHLRERYPNDN